MKIANLNTFEDAQYLLQNEIEIDDIAVIAGPHDDDPISCLHIGLYDPYDQFDGDKIVFNKTSSGFQIEADEDIIVTFDVPDVTHTTMHFGNISNDLKMIELWLVHERAATPKLLVS